VDAYPFFIFLAINVEVLYEGIDNYYLLEMAQLAQLVLVETYYCPAGQTNALEPGQTIQTSGQPRCDKATGFSAGLCPTGQITGTTFYLPSETNHESWSKYKMSYIVRIRGFQLNTYW